MYYDENYWVGIIVTTIVCITILYFIIKNEILSRKYKSNKPKKNIYCKNQFCLVEESKIPKYVDIPYFRDIPCNGDLYKIFWVAKSFELGVTIKGFIGANILKWIIEEKVKINKKGDLIKLKIKRFHTDNFIEKDLQRIILDLAEDEVIEIQDLENKLKVSSDAIKWYDNIFYNERDRLIEEKYLIKQDKLIISNEVYKDISQIVGLIKFLKSETYISEKSGIDVLLWDKYIMFAQMFGFADSLESKYKDFYKLVDFDTLRYLEI